MKIGICITTHNRREELARTLGALQQLTPPADELLVCADGCTDGTVAWLQSAHPAVRLIEHAVSRGSIPVAQRTRNRLHVRGLPQPGRRQLSHRVRLHRPRPNAFRHAPAPRRRRFSAALR
jgi:glycosyltransferase involved in cell wall biosynthesis